MKKTNINILNENRPEKISGRTLKNIICAVVALVLSVSIIISTASVVRGESSAREEALDMYYDSLEHGFEKQVRSYLNECGFINSGIMITHIVDADGYRSYKVTLHHRALDVLDGGQLEALEADIIELSFEDEICSFNVEILND